MIVWRQGGILIPVLLDTTLGRLESIQGNNGVLSMIGEVAIEPTSEKHAAREPTCQFVVLRVR